MTNQITTTTTLPIRPEPLSIYVLHSPATRRAHRVAEDAYFSELARMQHAEDMAKQRAEAAARAEAERPLSDDEYYALALARKQVADDRAAAVALVEKEADLAEINLRLSSPPTVEVTHRSEFKFLQDLMYWASRDYTLSDSGFHGFGMGIYHVTLTAPEAVKKAKQ